MFVGPSLTPWGYEELCGTAELVEFSELILLWVPTIWSPAKLLCFEEWVPLLDEAAVAFVISLPNSLGFNTALGPFKPSLAFLLFSLFPATWLGAEE